LSDHGGPLVGSRSAERAAGRQESPLSEKLLSQGHGGRLIICQIEEIVRCAAQFGENLALLLPPLAAVGPQPPLRLLARAALSRDNAQEHGEAVCVLAHRRLSQGVRHMHANDTLCSREVLRDGTEKHENGAFAALTEIAPRGVR
jgi:hypothetical protein